MLKLIESVIDSGRNDYDVVTRSDNLLCQLEQAGMLPPRTQIKKHSELTDDDGKVITSGMISVPANEWEPEQETCDIPEYAYKCPNCKCGE